MARIDQRCGTDEQVAVRDSQPQFVAGEQRSENLQLICEVQLQIPAVGQQVALERQRAVADQHDGAAQ